ncbi:hypothetical protein DY130_00615 [Apilactobacillus micheneri]|uniref:DNA/RNA non-specific endonuclease/pyrophosphatase/phosphodiesterase domain-containing protein n=1 Tax=Apilactobacillus micheneri TaxID=1899430 RepID=A0A9Q8MU98_9LACO|nr:hypothetical protein DY121_00615 [Apilactobacillus micheneri]TPR46048.1 hypothetical protein DY130_00615 [Apilactobacillus micheneri]TPR46733.1 hypothetical protein DY128_00615 [Apilactobacillus micheneri]
MKKILTGGIVTFLLLALLGSCMGGKDSSKKNSNSSSEPSSSLQSSDHSSSHSDKHVAKKQAKATKKHVQSDNELADLNYTSGAQAFTYVNNDHANLKTTDWKYNHVIYSNLDNLNRTSAGNTAYLESRNVANDSLRSTQDVKPTGWHQKFINREAIINRGHEIAYSLSKGISVNGNYEPRLQSGDQNNLKNLFTQTAFSNQKVQTIYESKVRDALRAGKNVIYQVTPVFKGSDLMARGVHLQALSTDNTLDFNVYLYNVQPGVQFNYADGTSKIDHNINVPTPAGAPSFSEHRNYNGEHYHRHHYVRDALIAGAAHHYIKRHYQRKYERHYYYHPYHRHFYGYHRRHHLF